MVASAPMIESEPQDLSQSMEVEEIMIDSGVSGFDLSIPLVIITIILGGLTLYYFLKSRKNN